MVGLEVTGGDQGTVTPCCWARGCSEVCSRGCRSIVALMCPGGGSGSRRPGLRTQGPGGRCCLHFGHSGPAACQRVLLGLLGSAWGLRACPSVPKVPPGTRGQSSITPGTSMVPRGGSLPRRPTADGPDFHVGKSLFSLSPRTGPSKGTALVPAGFQESCTPRQWSRKSGLSLQTCLGIPQALGHQVATLIEEPSFLQRKRPQA